MKLIHGNEEERMSSITRLCCCAKTSREASRNIAITDMILFTILFLFIAAGTIILIVSPVTIKKIFPFEEDLENFMKFEATRHTSRYRWFILGWLLCWCIGEIGFALILFYGSKKCSYPMVRGWIFLIIIDCLFGMVVFIPLAALSTQRYIYITIAFIYYVYRVCSLWAVHGLLREILAQMPWV